MKAEIVKAEKPEFEPITLTLTLETLKEALAFRALWGANFSAAAAVVRDGAYMAGIDDAFVGDLYTDAFLPVQQELESRGLLK